MPTSKVQKLCKTNKEALRWCKTRGAIIEFDNWKKRIGFPSIPAGITCMISITKVKKGELVIIAPWQAIDKTMMGSVNKWIKHITKMKK